MSQATSPKSLIQTTMKDLFLHSQFSDMTVTCQGFTFKVHRSILCTQSDFFKAAMNGNFKEGKGLTVDLPKDDLETIERVLSFLYFNYYSEDSHIMDLSPHLKTRKATTSASRSKKKGGDENITAYNHVRVYVAADKFGILSLKKFAAERFGEWCEHNWESKDFHAVLELSMAMIPPHDTSFHKAISSVISENIVELVRNGAISQFVESQGKIGWGIISDLIHRCQVWEPSWDRAVVNLMNNALERSKCHQCGDSQGELRVDLQPGDIRMQRYRCGYCGTVYRNV
ncbi:hypothetical protein ASPVEDRAFT_147284 [Aspergillus versicolor CBS 583.65]|uniref:BTB domain-containing protein n=1 Tax=Aspergillus versicolor CBS 583.65 TaxID=1036611 RepID=A0A1L9P931_ASPVE|nr:uncharacterized protein ASPVEDRAFT_147284 [Aspergillus versicolor CBS 583.65]OJI97995.1 hypothetical protein ASPVEDRAFT_147284 [Aspergillus versicolor CBS 583.65]